MELKEILSKCDHTLLAQGATFEEIKALCDDGIRFGTASVCIPACFVRRAKEYVGDKLKICTVIGFPNGYDATPVKCFETALAVTERMIGIVERHPLTTGLFYNVNVPDVPAEEIKGYKVKGLAIVRYNRQYERREDPLGRPYYWAPRGKLPCDPDEDTDYAWLKKGYVTVTPMGYDSARFDAVDLSEEFGGEA